MDNKKCIFKAVIFDMDGTLLNTLSDLTDSGNHVLNKMNLKTYPEHEYKNFIGNGLKNLIIKMMPENSGETELKKAYDTFYACYEENKLNKTAPYSGIEKLLRELCACGVKTGIITNKPHIPACEMSEYYFKGLVELTYGAKDNIPKKPDPASLLSMINYFGVKADETLFVGDSAVDIKTAKNAGIKSCGVLWGFGKKEDIIEKGADYISKNADELRSVIFCNK